MENLSTIIIPALIGGLVAFLGSIINNALEKRSRIDESLREARLDAYQPLWKQMSLLPKWPKADDVTYKKLFDFSVWLRWWYFAQGGIFLSSSARKAYGDLQDEIQLAIAKQDATGKKERTELLSDPDYDLVRDKCSALRTELTRDLLSRRRAFLV